MTSIDIRYHNFSALRILLRDDLLTVWAAWLAVDCGTTREICATTDIDLLTFRPRSCDLARMGLIFVIDRKVNGRLREGIYRARTEAEWEGWKKAQGSAMANQLQML